jgi:hypothetical protein
MCYKVSHLKQDLWWELFQNKAFPLSKELCFKNEVKKIKGNNTKKKYRLSCHLSSYICAP